MEGTKLHFNTPLLLLRQSLRVFLTPVLPALRGLRRLAANMRARARVGVVAVTRGKPALFYVFPGFPRDPCAAGQILTGGAVKLAYLARRFPHSAASCNIAYTVSSASHPARKLIIAALKAKGAAVVLNQNGVYYPAWYGKGFARQNLPLIELQGMADYVAYQSEFCRKSAQIFLGQPPCPSAIVYNPVDLGMFFPRKNSLNSRGLKLLLIWNSSHGDYRLETALQTISLLKSSLPGIQLVIAGLDPSSLRDWELQGKIGSWMAGMKLSAENIQMLPRFNRKLAPQIFSCAQILLHPKYQDPCPGAVIEALACGLPVAYSATGGTPELAGDAGVGVPGPCDWEQRHPPSPAALAEAVMKIVSEYDSFSQKARSRAEQYFGIDLFLDKHARIFEEVMTSER